jgi:hypothetical protein
MGKPYWNAGSTSVQRFGPELWSAKAVDVADAGQCPRTFDFWMGE